MVVERPTLSGILSEKGLPGGLFVLGEVMFILRPLIYVLLIRKYGIRSWFPWSISLAVDIMGMSILSHVTTSWRSKTDRQIHLSNPEKHEVRVLQLLRCKTFYASFRSLRVSLACIRILPLLLLAIILLS